MAFLGGPFWLVGLYFWSLNRPYYNPLGKKLDNFQISGMCLGGVGRCLEVLLDDIWGYFWGVFGRFLGGF